MNSVIQIHNAVYLSYSFIESKGISYHVIKKWASRKNLKPIMYNGEAFLCYDIIPIPSKLKLPSIAELKAVLNNEQKDIQVENCLKKLQYAQHNKCSEYRAYYRDEYGFDSAEALKAAMKRAVWERIMQLYSDAQSVGYKGGLRKGALEILYKAYNFVYEGQYSSKQAFLRTINAVKGAGIHTIIVDKRKIKNGKTAKFGELHGFFVRGVLSIGKAYSAPDILQKITPMCREKNLEIPSLTWVKNYVRNHTKNAEFSTRYGTGKLEKTMPYSTMQPALNADSQWQIDGWNLPFYFRNEANRLDKLTLIAIRDAYSKKIVGYSIARSENRLSILEAFQDAIANTGCLPFEIVADNHSFNRTKEAENFIAEIKKIGTTWTVTENPQHKSIAERYFKNFGEQFCKSHYGYVGQGIKTNEKNGRTTDEMLYEFTKAGKILTEKEIFLIGISVVQEFNNAKLKRFNSSPADLYNQSDKPKRFEIDLYERLRILTIRSAYKISRGQINIVIAGKKHEYQLDASAYAKYNNKIVTVRYESPELIYLFDAKTDIPICAVRQKAIIHGALADQTAADIKLLAKAKGRRKGIIAQSRKESEAIRDAVLQQHPDAIEILHHYTTPKDVLKQAEIDYDFRQEVQKRGVDLSLVESVPKTTEITNPIYLNKKTSRSAESPFTPKNHIISTLEYDDYTDEQ